MWIALIRFNRQIEARVERPQNVAWPQIVGWPQQQYPAVSSRAGR
jgi:hypothetical protein